MKIYFDINLNDIILTLGNLCSHIYFVYIGEIYLFELVPGCIIRVTFSFLENYFVVYIFLLIIIQNSSNYEIKIKFIY